MSKHARYLPLFRVCGVEGLVQQLDGAVLPSHPQKPHTNQIDIN
jgi:hypothetical protein